MFDSIKRGERNGYAMVIISLKKLLYKRTIKTIEYF